MSTIRYVFMDKKENICLVTPIPRAMSSEGKFFVFVLFLNV